MSLMLTLLCNGTIRGVECQTSRGRSFGYSPEVTVRDDRTALSHALGDIRDGWRKLPDGGDLCPYRKHDQDTPSTAPEEPRPC